MAVQTAENEQSHQRYAKTQDSGTPKTKKKMAGFVKMARRSNPSRRVRPRLTASAPAWDLTGARPASSFYAATRICHCHRWWSLGGKSLADTCARGARQPRRETSPPPGPMATRAVASCVSPAPHAFRFVSFRFHESAATRPERRAAGRGNRRSPRYR